MPVASNDVPLERFPSTTLLYPEASCRRPTVQSDGAETRVEDHVALVVDGMCVGGATPRGRCLQPRWVGYPLLDTVHVNDSGLHIYYAYAVFIDARILAGSHTWIVAVAKACVCHDHSRIAATIYVVIYVTKQCLALDIHRITWTGNTKSESGINWLHEKFLHRALKLNETSGI
nr:hypothetical protein [Tanacetum cinerariifolium]